MTTGIVYTSTFPPKTGPCASDRRVRDLARGLNFKGEDVHVFIPRWHDSGEPNKDPSEYRVHFVGSVFDKIPLLNRVAFWFKLPLKAKRLNCKAVIYYSPTIDSAISMVFFKFTRVVTLLEVCDLVSFNFSRSLKGLLFYWGERLLPRLTDATLPISTAIRDFVLKFAPKTTTYLVPILVDNDVFKPDAAKGIAFRKKYDIDEETVVIGYVGGMYKTYGADMLMEAFSRIKGQVPFKTKLVIAGRLEFDSHGFDAKELAIALNAEQDIILTGWADTELVTTILNASDILTIPHLNTEANNAGLPTKLAEYAAIGKAVLATDVGDIRQYFKHLDDIYIVEGSNLEALQTGLELLILDQELRSRIAKGIKLVGDVSFSYQANGKLLSDIIELESEKKRNRAILWRSF